MSQPSLNAQSILATELVNLGARPAVILEALVHHRKDRIDMLYHNWGKEDIVDTCEHVKELSFIINELSEATGIEVTPGMAGD